jgi:hypothetical protein
MRNAGLSEITLPELNGGLNTRDPETGIADNQSPDMLNLWYKDMALCKRPGQMMMSLLPDVKRISDPYNGSLAVHAGKRIYRWDGLGAVRYLPEYRKEFRFEAGDWFVATLAGTLDGVVYQPGDCMIYNTTDNAGQVETATVKTEEGGISAGSVPTDPWTVKVSVTAPELDSEAIVFTVPVTAGDTAAQVAAKIRAALSGASVDAEKLKAVYSVGGGDDASSGQSTVTLTRRIPDRKDDLLNIAIVNGNCSGLVEAPESVDTPFWHNAIIRVDAPRSRGTFDPSAGYPLLASPGDCYIARTDGTSVGVTYQAGDIAVYDRQAAALTVTGTVTAAGSATVTVTTEGTSVDFTITLVAGDDAATVAAKIRDALDDNALLLTRYTLVGSGAEVTLRCLTSKDIDATLKIILSGGKNTGIGDASSADASVWHREGGMVFSEAPGVFCEFGDTLYYIQGGEIWQVNADYGMNPVEPYTPTVLITARPDLSESADSEAYNLIGTGFTVKYNGDNDATYYVLSADTNTFTITKASGGTTKVDITKTGLNGWRIKKSGTTAWMPGTPTVNVDTDTIILNTHGLKIGEAVQFGHGTGTLPEGIKAATLLYHLPQTNLDADSPVRVTVGIATDPYTMELAKDTHFSVDYAAGTVNFGGGSQPFGPQMPGTNNVWITAHKDVPGGREKITGCTVALRFGGEAAGMTGGTRVFVMGNPKYPYHLWRSDLGMHVSAGMAYFPDTSEEVLDQNSDAITAAAKMGEQLIVFKENSVFAIGYSYDGKDAYYPVRECNSAIGCDMPGSVQLIDNRLVFAHSRSGVHMLVSSDNALENIIKPISANINALLLREPDIKSACSCDFDRYYWLKAGGHIYLWDYDTTPYYNYSDYDKAQKRLAWYRFDNINAAVFCPLESSLYYGSPNGIVRLYRGHNDFGQAMNAYFKSKAFDLGSPNELKTFVSLYPGFSADGNIFVKVTVANEKTDNYKSWEKDIRSFDWRTFNLGAFTWHRIKFAQVYEMRLNMRMATFLQVKMSGNALDRGVGLSSLRITYYRNRKVRGEKTWDFKE